MKKPMTILLFLLVPFLLIGSICDEEYKTITEILNDHSEEQDIFLCKILQTYKENDAIFQSRAVVTKKYRGAKTDTVIILNGNIKMIPNSEWIIICKPKGKANYRIGSCFNLSNLVTPASPNSCDQSSDFGKLYLDIIEQYEEVKSAKFTGKKVFLHKEKMIAEGGFKDGKPHGNWLHYSKQYLFKEKILRSHGDYKNGLPDGTYKVYSSESKVTALETETAYENGKVIWREQLGSTRYEYHYVDNGLKIITKEMDAETGKVVKKIETFQKDAKNNSYETLTFRDGIYINKSSKDSSEYFPLAEGVYLRGARIGQWKFFNKKGEVVKEEFYENKKIDSTTFEIFNEEGILRLKGKYDGNKRIGVWKYYHDGKLVSEKYYNINGMMSLEIKKYAYGSKIVTPFLNGKKHGSQIKYSRDGKVRSIESFLNDEQQGISIFYNDKGEITDELNYVHSRKNTVYTAPGKVHFKNGFKHGYYISPKSNRQVTKTEGNYWYGYRTGTWIIHYSNGNYNKKYYETDPNKLMARCNEFGDSFLKLERFDKNNVLLKTEYFDK